MRLAVTGREGQVVSSLVERARTHPDVEVFTLGRPELDLAKPETIERAVVATRPDLVVSAAAYTAVDQAEDEPDLAFAVNGIGAGHVAAAAARIGAPVIHLSTDYVFDGSGEGAYVEEDEPAPRSVYGASKLAGEHAVARANPRHLILRTAWVYSPFGRNFVKTMLRLAAARDEIAVVADQWGNPTSALDIADAILHVAQILHGNKGFASFGVYHLAGTGDTNWSGFARHILDTSRVLGGPYAQVRDIATVDYPTKAQRPRNSRLATQKFATAFGWIAPSWHNSTTEVERCLLRPTSGCSLPSLGTMHLP
ncbi:dTDP-4-dehydrorhamnose reductase [Mesorhizobium sp.]|uniref:dTDP-4-dehydrorhamnose reductase n=1 Tax=Mesorhizobium sp. TaxID=1871066 RepID=UPI000FE5389A|nr:dTDP-4-dehydrorhamnose reductase [Mesorhizobium sp.]RWP73336.1 MAG: dTDP-4-dehydrorhamnose reductase [Mesorhizobium sp.]